MDKLKMHTPDMTQDNIARIRELFPNCVTEAKDKNGNLSLAVDFDALRQELSASIVEGERERYRLDWPGKKEAMLAANAPIAKTLRPCREESVDFDTTQNIFIEGDNLDALKLLQESYLGKVKMIYIDPPYNTGNDFLYDDDFAETAEEYLERSHQQDETGRLVANTESNGRFHSDWLSMMYPRLKLARNLLADDGVIFISIDDNEINNICKLCDVIFGNNNFIGIFCVNASPSAIDYGHLAKMHDYAVMYAKNIAYTTTNQIPEKDKTYKFYDENGGFNIYPLYHGNVAFNPKTRPNLYYPFYINKESKIDKNFYEISIEYHSGWEEVYPVTSSKDNIPHVWRWGKEKSSSNINKEIVGYKNDNGEYRIVQKSRTSSKTIRSLLLDNSMASRRGTAEIQELFSRKVFSFPKPVELIKNFVLVGSAPGSIILDFFAGSSTTAHAVMQLNAEDGGNRRFIMVQLPEVCDEKSEAAKAGYKTIAEISKERIRRAGKKIKEELASKQTSASSTGQASLLDAAKPAESSLDTGFRVLKVDSSNMNDVFYNPDAVTQKTLMEDVSSIKYDRSDEDLLFQVLLDWGVDLSLPIRREKRQGRDVYLVDENALVACFDKNITEELVQELAELQPLRVVFRDDGFASDAVKINVDQIFRQISPGTLVKSL